MLKVVWLCHLSNSKLKKHFNVSKVNEFAPWISLLIEMFKNNKEIEIHIVAPNVFTNKDSVFKIEGVHYYFYKHKPVPIYHKYFLKIHSILKIEEKTNYLWVKNKISKIINFIKPNLIHIHGIENPYYAIGFFEHYKKIPTVISIQGFLRNVAYKNPFTSKVRLNIEEDILRYAENIGIRASFMEDYIREVNTQAKFFWLQYPYSFSHISSDITKDTDLVFFGQVSKNKGIEDLINALGILHKEKNMEVRLRVIGSVSKNYLPKLLNLSQSLGINKNIEFTGFIQTQREVHELASRSKICVLPTYNDIYSGTIVESMYLKIPVIAYEIPGLMDLKTEKGQSIIFTEKANVESLASAIHKLLNNTNLQKEMSENAYLRVKELFKEEDTVRNYIECYKAISH